MTQPTIIDGTFLAEERADITCPTCGSDDVTLRRWRPVTGEADDLRYWCHACEKIWVVKP